LTFPHRLSQKIDSYPSWFDSSWAAGSPGTEFAWKTQVQTGKRWPSMMNRVETMATTTSLSLRLLIVDDDEQLRQTLVARFRRQGMLVTEAGTAEEALIQAAQTRFDVGLLDLHLPGM